MSPPGEKTETVPLASLTVGQRGRIARFDLPPDQRQRMLEMGFTVGAECELIRFAPMGDPLEVKVRGYHLSLRRSEASAMHVHLL